MPQEKLHRILLGIKVAFQDPHRSHGVQIRIQEQAGTEITNRTKLVECILVSVHKCICFDIMGVITSYFCILFF